MKFTVVVFPGTSGHKDCLYVLRELLGQEAEALDYRERLSDPGCVILPGGASFGDYLRPGALASSCSIMDSIGDHAKEGGLVLGIGNGFQILLEAGLLPGAILPNCSLRFIARPQVLRVENANTPFTNLYQEGQLLQIPIAHGAGNYFIDSEQELEGQIIFRYADEAGNVNEVANPNGSVGNIAGITNRAGNVLGMMPHPERSCEEVLGSTDGLALFRAIIGSLERGKVQC